MKLLKTLKNYTFYTLLSLCCFAFIYVLLSWIGNDFYWINEMLLNTRGRGAFVMIFILSSFISALVCLLVDYIKKNN